MPSNILVIKLGALGDIILAQEAFQAIRAHHPGGRIILLTRPNFVSLTAKMPWFDEIWTDPLLKFWQVSAILAFRRKLREAGFIRAYDLQDNDRSRFYFSLAGSPPGWTGSSAKATYRHPRFKEQHIHATERLLRVLDLAGVPRGGGADMTWLHGEVDPLGLPPRFVMLIPGCAPQHLHKRWPAERYAELARRLLDRGLAVVLIGTGADQASIDAVQAAASDCINLCDRTSIGQLAELARRCLGAVGNDTGPSHIVGAAGAPTLVLMCGSSDPVRMLPRGPRVGWLQKDKLDDLGVAEVEAALLLRDQPAS